MPEILFFFAVVEWYLEERRHQQQTASSQYFYVGSSSASNYFQDPLDHIFFALLVQIQSHLKVSLFSFHFFVADLWCIQEWMSHWLTPIISMQLHWTRSFQVQVTRLLLLTWALRRRPATRLPPIYSLWLPRSANSCSYSPPSFSTVSSSSSFCSQ